MDQSALDDSYDLLMLNSIRTKMIAERMAIATHGNDFKNYPSYDKWIANFDMNVSNCTFRRLPSQISGNCSELNKFYCLLGKEESFVDTIFQEMRSTFVKCNDADQLLKKIKDKKASLIQEKKLTILHRQIPCPIQKKQDFYFYEQK